MTEASLKELGAAFENWRKNKRNAREAVPTTLWGQTLRAAEIYGATAVSQVTKVQRSRIVERAEKGKRTSMKVPPFSQVSILAPSVPSQPIAEVQTTGGLKLRVFVQTPEMLELLSSLCSTGGVQ